MFEVVFTTWEDEESFPFINSDHEAYKALYEIDQDGFFVDIIAHPKDLKCLSHILKNFKNPFSMQISNEDL